MSEPFFFATQCGQENVSLSFFKGLVASQPFVVPPLPNVTPPSATAVDYRDGTTLTSASVKDQYSCGCSYVFAAVSQLECFLSIVTGVPVQPISIDPMLTCYDILNARQCQGGNVFAVLRKMGTNMGVYGLAVDLGDDYMFADPTTNSSCLAIAQQCISSPQNSTCTASYNARGCNSLITSSPCVEFLPPSPPTTTASVQFTTITIPFDYTMRDLGFTSATMAMRELVYANALKAYGPFAVGMYAPYSLTQYSAATGVYNAPVSADLTINHAVLLCGYTSTYWILMNSWGSPWGVQGFFYLPKGNDAYGPTGPLNMLTTFPVVFCENS